MFCFVGLSPAYIFFLLAIHVVAVTEMSVCWFVNGGPRGEQGRLTRGCAVAVVQDGAGFALSQCSRLEVTGKRRRTVSLRRGRCSGSRLVGSPARGLNREQSIAIPAWISLKLA